MAMNKGILFVVITAIVSGFSIFLNSFAVKGFDSSVFTFTKNTVVAILLFTLIYAISKCSEIKSLRKKHWKDLMIIGLIGGAIPFILFFKGLQMSTGTMGSFIHKILFIFATVLAVFFLKEKPGKWMIIGGLGILTGTYLMIRPDFNLSMGHVLIFIAVVFWSVENILAKKALHDLSGNIVALGRMFFGSLFILIYLVFTGKAQMIFSMSSDQYVWIIITSLLLLVYVISYYNGLKNITVTAATAILSLGAPITALLSLAYGTGKISVYDSIGILLMIVGSVLIIYHSQSISSKTVAGA